MSRLVRLRLFDRFLWRAAVFLPVIALLALLAFFPERYRASASLSPTDSASMGLSGALGQLGGIDNVFGSQAAVEVALRVARSVDVGDQVIAQARLQSRKNGADRVALHRWLDRRVDIRSLRGGIILVEMKDPDAQMARDIVASYVLATRQQLAVISRNQTNYKRTILKKLVNDTLVDVAETQAKYDDYRIRKGYIDPNKPITMMSDRISMLEADIKGREIVLSTAQKLYTNDNIIVKQQLAELSAVRRQLATAKSTSNQTPLGLRTLTDSSNELFLLERNVALSRSLYDNYLRYLQGTTVEDLTATGNVRVLEDAHISTSRQYSVPALMGALVMLLMWLALELYRLRPPVGERFDHRTSHA